MPALTVLIDACVLYPAPLRDLVMHLALADLFRAKWTDRIHEEWITNVLANRPDLSRGQLDRTRTLMDAHVRDALVTGYESLIDSLALPDPGDRHVLAAAICCQADLILTFNLKDFPADGLEPYGIEAQHPDPFLFQLLRLDQGSVLAALKRQRAMLTNPPMTSLDFLDRLERQHLPLTVAELRRYADLI